MANGDMVTEAEDWKRIERVIDFCNDCVVQEGCRKYCDDAEKVRDGNG
jgi:hypothetical protein